MFEFRQLHDSSAKIFRKQAQQASLFLTVECRLMESMAQRIDASSSIILTGENCRHSLLRCFSTQMYVDNFGVIQFLKVQLYFRLLVKVRTYKMFEKLVIETLQSFNVSMNKCSQKSCSCRIASTFFKLLYFFQDSWSHQASRSCCGHHRHSAISTSSIPQTSGKLPFCLPKCNPYPFSTLHWSWLLGLQICG